MTKKNIQTFSIRMEKSLIKDLEKFVAPLSTKSDLARNILREWIKEKCK